METLTAYNQILIFEEKLCSPMWIFNTWLCEEVEVTTEYTQSGKSRFLAYISSWKKKPWLVTVRVGGTRPPPFTLFTIMYKVAVNAPAERADTLPLYRLYPYMYSVVVTQLANVLMLMTTSTLFSYSYC